MSTFYRKTYSKKQQPGRCGKDAVFSRGLSVIISCMFLASLTSCLSMDLKQQTGSIPLPAENVFTNDVIKRALPEIEKGAGRKITSDEVFNAVREILNQHSISFYKDESSDSSFQELLDEVSVIRASEICGRFASEKTGQGPFDRNMAVFLPAVRQLLLISAINTLPLADKIERLIDERRWEADAEYSDSSDLFFDIIQLESDAAYLRKVRKQLPAYAAGISYPE